MKMLRIAAASALLADLAATLLAWQRLPEQVPAHWGWNGEVDRLGSRTELLLLGPGVLLLLWAVFELLPRIDPRFKASADPEQTESERLGALPTAAGITFGIVTAGHVIVLLAGLGTLEDARRAHALLLAGFTLAFGNFIGRLRPSWFVGIRTPWTLSSDEVWRRTHRLAGRLMVPAGLLALLAALALPAGAAFTAAISLLLFSVLLPAAASFFFWRAGRT